MTLKDYKNKLRNAIRKLKLIHLYREHFLERLGGKKALQNYIDEMLDEINELKEEIIKLENNGKED